MGEEVVCPACSQVVFQAEAVIAGETFLVQNKARTIIFQQIYLRVVIIIVSDKTRI